MRLNKLLVRFIAQQLLKMVYEDLAVSAEHLQGYQLFFIVGLLISHSQSVFVLFIIKNCPMLVYSD